MIARAIAVVSLLFILLGISWFIIIQVRCEEIYPKPRPTGSETSHASVSVSKSVVDPWMRSKDAKDFHFVLFWAIAVIEVFVSVFYCLAGIFLLKKYSLANFIANFVLILDFGFKVLVVGFMKWAAIPLALATKNPNLIEAYFHPSLKWYNEFSMVVSGLLLFKPAGLVNLGIYIFYFGFLFMFLNRLETQAYLNSKAKKA